MGNSAKLSVLLTQEEAGRFESYCEERGYKKSTLIARLIREHLDREHFTVQIGMFDSEKVMEQSS